MGGTFITDKKGEFEIMFTINNREEERRIA